MKNNSTVILGCRGSMSSGGKSCTKYGGLTTSFAIKLDDQIVVIDAGSGILKLAEYVEKEKNIPLLFTHAHLDHLMGFPMCPLIFRKDISFEIYSETTDILSLVMRRPLWPVSAEELPAGITGKKIESEMEIGGIKLLSMDGNHPGGVKLFRLNGSKSIVVMTDCTILDENYEAYAQFAKDCDLLLIDGQYSDEEWENFKNFGHNSYMFASEFAKNCGAKAARIVHHSPQRTDEQIDGAAAKLAAKYENISFAFEGEEILL